MVAQQRATDAKALRQGRPCPLFAVHEQPHDPQPNRIGQRAQDLDQRIRALRHRVIVPFADRL